MQQVGQIEFTSLQRERPSSAEMSGANLSDAVSTQEVTVPPLKAGETHAITVQGTGAGITAWRYSKK